jgi:hypothetical protein
LDDSSSGHILIKSNISLKKAGKLINRDNLVFKLFYDSQLKKIFAYELNGNDQRETVLGEITRQIGNYTVLEAVGNRFVTSHGVRQFGVRIINPDQGLRLRNPASLNSQMYRLIVQVGFAESENSLHDHAAYFCAPN